uniref:Uncharacterized protein n=1 Tax=Anopheles atroparvus TaxID=41427 RepID=A0A182IQV5_ANOAO
MVSIVPSRFAGLKIEDDDDEFRKPKQKPKTTASAKPKPANKPQKAKTHNEAEQKEQWSKWQEKDSELVEKSYMTDLEQALLLSKLDFEANKTKYTQSEQEAKQLTGKVKKPKTFSLQEFQEQVSKDVSEKEQQRQIKQAEEEYNKHYSFFEQIDLETKQIVSKEQIKSLFQARDVSACSKDAKENAKKVKQTQAAASEVDQLKAENVCLKEEIAVLRDKFKKVVSMLKSGEMKEKTELLVEIEKLKKTQEDMTAELTALYGELEQAKSKSNQDLKDQNETPTTEEHEERIGGGTKETMRFVEIW